MRLGGSGIHLNVLVSCKSRVLGGRKLNHMRGHYYKAYPGLEAPVIERMSLAYIVSIGVFLSFFWWRFLRGYAC